MGTGQQILQQLNQLRGSKTLIIGIGNTLKGDDGAGPLVCERLAQASPSATPKQAGKTHAEVIDAGTVPENYIQTIIKKAPQNLLIIDAIDFGAPPGAMDIFRPEQISSFTFSTHSPSPRLFIDMITRQIKVDVYLIGIQPAQTQLGQSTSTPVSKAIQQLSQALAEVFKSKA
jgi:hydrogenase 3 maturation protease